MHIARWFQSTTVCAGLRAGSGMFEEAGDEMAQCLFTQAMYDRLDTAAQGRLAAVVERHFPARSWCERCEWSPITRLIHFNNHPETTREDLDKVLRVFTEEEDARHADA